MTTPSRPAWTVEDLPVCNCADCFRELLGKIPMHRAKEVKSILAASPTGVPRRSVAGRLDGRPYCRARLRSRGRPALLEGAGYNGRRVNDKPAPQ